MGYVWIQLTSLLPVPHLHETENHDHFLRSFSCTYKSTQLYWFTSSKCCVNVVTVIMNMTFSRQPEVTYHERTWLRLTAKAVIIKSKKRNLFVTFSRKEWIPMQFGIQKEGWLGLFSVNGGLICFHSILNCSLYMNKTWVTHNMSTLSEGV